MAAPSSTPTAPAHTGQPLRQPLRHSAFRVYIWVLSFLRPYRSQLALLIGCGIVISAAEMAIPRGFQYFFDHILPSKDTSKFLWLIAILLAIMGITFIANAWQTMLQRKMGERASSDIQFAIFSHLRLLGFSHFEKNPVGDSVTLVNTDVGQVQSIFRDFLPLAASRLLVMCIALLFLLYTSPQLSIVLLPCIPLYLALGPYINKKSAELDAEWMRLAGLVGKRTYDSVSALPELRAAGASEWNLSEVLADLKDQQKVHLRHLVYLFLSFSYRSFCGLIGAAAIFAYGAVLLASSSITIGQFIAFTFYYFLFINSFMSVINTLTEQKVMMLHATRLHRFMAHQPEVREPEAPVDAGPIRGEIAFHEVSFHYGAGQPVLHGLTFQIRQGEKVALVGSSGNGKTTILKLIPRFYDPVEGHITLDGVPLNQLSFERLRGAVGYVFQETYLFGRSVRDNIRFGNPQATDDEVAAAAQAAHAHDFITALPQGYDTLVGERGIKLSGGQRQRISIARMFVQNPRIVLLDEATSALDNISEREVQDALNRLLEGRTTIAIAHRLTTVKDYDRIFYIENGTIAEQGSYAELMAARGAFYKLSEGSGQHGES